MAKTKPAAKTAAMNAALDHENRTKTPARAKASTARNQGAPATAVALMIGPFEEEFCFQYATTGLPVPAYMAALIKTGQDLDLSNYEVHVFKEFDTVQEVDSEGRPTGETRKVMTKLKRTISTRSGMLVKEEDVVYGKAANLLYYPEIRQRIAAIREERAKAIKVSAEQIADDLDRICDHAMTLGQTNVAAQTRQMKARLFGIETGTGDGDKTPEVTEVRINIRDCTKAKEA